MWTPRHRGVLAGFVLVLSIVLVVRLYVDRAYISDPQPIQSARHDELADRIDPNIAPWRELAVLPQLGEKRAKEIVAYRERYVADHPGGVAFKRAADLNAIKGIGAATLETLRPHLMFPTTSPAANAAP
jgi:DNA uptake protein ComE-like DNA-binding protein